MLADHTHLFWNGVAWIFMQRGEMYKLIYEGKHKDALQLVQSLTTRILRNNEGFVSCFLLIKNVFF